MIKANKVYLVLEGIDYEGYLEPNAVFDSMDKAVIHKSLLDKENPEDYYSVEIFEMDLL